jgi:hypothetical protein
VDGKRLFFKTHTEQDNQISEYYNAAMLADAGYPVIQPIYSSTRAGQHLLIYEVINDPSVFELAWQIENGDHQYELAELTSAQNVADDNLLNLYMETLQHQSVNSAKDSPIHQLFYHRLVAGRLQRFYGGLAVLEAGDVTIKLPDGDYLMREIQHKKWIINGQRYELSLGEIIDEAIQILNPLQSGPSIIGHGDAHNGNIFFHTVDDQHSLLYFDPAFAGRHHPALDLAKPLFHNVFAMWMYYPDVKREQTAITFNQDGLNWYVEHNYQLPPIRRMFLQSKVQRTFIPIMLELKRRGNLRDDWRPYLKSALFCCPFLTLNLADSERFPPEISLLGLCMAVEMGTESYDERSLIDQTLDVIESALL